MMRGVLSPEAEEGAEVVGADVEVASEVVPAAGDVPVDFCPVAQLEQLANSARPIKARPKIPEQIFSVMAVTPTS